MLSVLDNFMSIPSVRICRTLPREGEGDRVTEREKVSWIFHDRQCPPLITTTSLRRLTFCYCSVWLHVFVVYCWETWWPLKQQHNKEDGENNIKIRVYLTPLQWLYARHTKVHWMDDRVRDLHPDLQIHVSNSIQCQSCQCYSFMHVKCGWGGKNDWNLQPIYMQAHFWQLRFRPCFTIRLGDC